ncbi:Glycoside hydrolase family 16 [Lasiodiplodia theobromae]|uniref:Beta-1,3-glucan-binding protein n=1 Tax=Lasiodiplodia theobromae TaxID=45133 RepID=A0A5N5D159_9PEZI|nr:Glycoside hydrolase family 16 [Lasiodiplodia theobromae]KAB2571124.1 Beta-1,3-glucan-binding protein [Lasiodiplodia theobromae]KAF4535481.1 Glycoside hydrolase family 16 [Lasiodiplodia theobromae]
MQRPTLSEKSDHAGDGRISPQSGYSVKDSRPQSIQAAIDPFATPHGSQPSTRPVSYREFPLPSPGAAPYFKSRRVPKGTVQTPKALQGKKRNDPWLWVIPMIGALVGFAVSGLLIWLGINANTSPYNYCPVLMEDFSSGSLDSSVWTKEIRLNGFGNGEFDQTTADEENVFIKDGQLYIKPTLQDATLMETNNVINLTALGTCTSTVWSDCVGSTNTTNGTVLPPAKSARLTTKLGASIKYGRVEVKAKLPKGDWLWPAIWMLPTESVYGDWPRSGEIDILESRGNNYTYNTNGGGNDFAIGTLHWGPDSDNDGYYQTTNRKQALHSMWGDGFHTYGLEWTDKYIYTYIDSQLLQVLYIPFKKNLWSIGNFPTSTANGTRLTNPWADGATNAPFDQEFYLILNVAVGGTNGWFTDGKYSKPWIDSSSSAKKDFWNARNQWYPTWEKNGEMIVDSVKMWKHC